MNSTQEVDVNHMYAGTLNLPKTEFPMRANAVEREPQLLKDVYQLYKWQEANNKGPLWVTHDGPPYANGDLHLGHVLNKVLKDFVNRYKMMRGYRVSYVPGWDCHGLPIELKALERLKTTASKMTPQELRSTARAFALSEVEKQKQAFKSWGVMGDWENPYLTLHPEYEAAQLSLFYDMFSKGYVYRGVRPVHWSPSSLTALADAELEYNEAHVSNSVYVAFQFKTLSAAAEQALQATLAEHNSPLSNVYAVIWTTTPWTLPANVAVCANNEVKYALVRAKNENNARLYVVADERVEFLKQELEKEFEVLGVLTGAQLEHSVCHHPFVPTRESPLVLGDHVTTQTGTGLVHTAPGHGEEDFAVGKKYNLPVLSPVGEDGRFTEEAGDLFKGKFVLTEGNTAVLAVLQIQNALLKEKMVTHKYPYDWRTKKPIIVRTTPQWFVTLESVQGPAVRAVEKEVTMVPPSAATRLTSMLGGRSAWCISRQRSWGVPLPVFYDEKGEPLVTKETVAHVEQLVRQHGTDCWWSMDVSDLLPPQFRNNGVKYVKSTDTMDVWFDSGVSWRSVLRNRGLPCPADLYLEGSDQHRGWFQSSLLTSMCATGTAPYKTVVTHGFVLDEKGRKMSKSLGNVIPPSLITHGGADKRSSPAYGVDVLRFFVASADFTKDVNMGTKLVGRVAESLKQLRNRLRFLLSNTNDFEFTKDQVPYAQLGEVEKYLLLRLYEFGKEVEEAYEKFNFTKVYKLVANFSNLDLSSFYFELIKRRLYTEAPTSVARRSAQTALSFVLDVLLKSLAPVLPHTAEDVYRHWVGKPYSSDSVFCTGWFELKEEWNAKTLMRTWSVLMRLRDDTNKMLENMRNKGLLRRPEEVDLELSVPEPLQAFLLSTLSENDLAEVLLVSNLNVVVAPPSASAPTTPPAATTTEESNKEGSVETEARVSAEREGEAVQVYAVKVTARKSPKHKCARCWRHRADEEGKLCPPCSLALSSQLL